MISQAILVANKRLNNGPCIIGSPLYTPWLERVRAVNVLDGVLVIQHVVIDVDARLKGGSVAELLVPRQKTVNLVLAEAVVEHRVIGQDIPVVDIVWQGVNGSFELGVDRGGHC